MPNVIEKHIFIRNMSKFRSLISGCIFFCSIANPANGNFLSGLESYIENPAIYEQNQESSRSHYIPEKHISLNGTWEFKFYNTPYEAAQDFDALIHGKLKWDKITVPSNWEMEGFGDKLFRNVTAPFTANPPYVPREYNPTGIYRKHFRMPKNWEGKQIFICLEKVASAYFIWINGKEVGYNEGAQEPAEFNITPYLKSGENDVTIFVVKYSDGYYLEGQDYWRLAGIFDDVYIYASPVDRLFDWQIITDLDDNYEHAELRIIATVKRYRNAPSKKYKLKAELIDNNRQPVTQIESGQFCLENSGEKTIDMAKNIVSPLKWTAETPYLYTLRMSLIGMQNDTADQAIVKIGFKETEIRNGVFYLNGRPIKIHAQNSHMQHPETGHVITEETIRKDFTILKQFNFNAVRTSHYPPVNRYLELADEYGLYIIDEVGDEAHATEYVCNDARFTDMYKERVRRMVLRDRNHPCILFWSAGNESGEGFNITEVVQEGKKLDPTRYWMYGGNAFSHPAEDIIGPRYPTPFELEVELGLGIRGEKRPSFMDEYLSVAGNGGGGLDEYWNVIYKYPQLMGGAIWDFVSVGLTEPVRILKDQSKYNTPVHIMGNAQRTKEKQNHVLDLNGHDQWIEIYRQHQLEIQSNQLTLSCDVFPRKLNYSSGTFITKGSYQFGLQQTGKDSLEFYLYTNKKHSLKTKLPENWENNWHNIKGVYDGKRMFICIDNIIADSINATGHIKNFPFPVNVGRNAELHGQETNTYLCDALIDNVVIYDKALFDEKQTTHEPLLRLDFEEETNHGTFYSYGIGARTYGSIWPDRSVQPEMWQMKKSAQPIVFSLIDAQNGMVELWNRQAFTNSSAYQITWQLEADNRVLESGVLHTNTLPLSKDTLTINYTKPKIEPGTEYRLSITSCLKEKTLWAEKGFEVAWDQLEMNWFEQPLPIKTTAREIRMQENDSMVTIEGNNFKYGFNKNNGKLCSFMIEDTEMLKEPLDVNFWRAPLANELDAWCSANAKSPNWKEGYGHHVATEFYSIGIDRPTTQLTDFNVSQNASNIIINTREIIRLGDTEERQKDLYVSGIESYGFENLFTYKIDDSGKMYIEHKIIPNGKMPLWLPRLGVSMVLDKQFKHVKWYGRGPQENYPDRKTGYKIGVYESDVFTMYEPYLMPQDYGLRTDNRWLIVHNGEKKGMKIEGKTVFNFNLYPFSTDNLTKAMYTYQLQEYSGLTLNIDHKTSGVGCTARSIENRYRVMPQMYEYSFSICPYTINNNGKKESMRNH